MKIEIKNKFTGNISVSGHYKNIRECLENNRSADLEGADLRGANLKGADLRHAYLTGADLTGAYLAGASLGHADLEGAYLVGAYLVGAYLGHADLRGADLKGANLKGADLGYAYLVGIKNYSENHEIFQEIVRRQSMNAFTSLQWSMIGQILIHRLCWESIEKRYGKKFLTVLSKIKKLGFGEYYDRYKEML